MKTRIGRALLYDVFTYIQYQSRRGHHRQQLYEQTTQ